MLTDTFFELCTKNSFFENKITSQFFAINQTSSHSSSPSLNFNSGLLDEVIIDNAFQKIIRNKTSDLQPHIIYAGSHYGHYHNLPNSRLISFIREGMTKYKMRSIMVTQIHMAKRHLITKERFNKFCSGKEIEKLSINDDFESLLNDLRVGEEPDDEQIWSYFLPKLTEEELDLVEKKDFNYMSNFDLWIKCADKTRGEMKPLFELKSESKDWESKFAFVECERQTFMINLNKDESYRELRPPPIPPKATTQATKK